MPSIRPPSLSPRRHPPCSTNPLPRHRCSTARRTRPPSPTMSTALPTCPKSTQVAQAQPDPVWPVQIRLFSFGGGGRSVKCAQAVPPVPRFRSPSSLAPAATPAPQLAGAEEEALRTARGTLPKWGPHRHAATNALGECEPAAALVGGPPALRSQCLLLLTRCAGAGRTRSARRRYHGATRSAEPVAPAHWSAPDGPVQRRTPRLCRSA